MVKGLSYKLTRILFAIVLLGMGFMGGQIYLNRVYQRQVEISYRRALSEFATHFQGLTAEIGLARLAKSDKQRNLIGANLQRLVYAAQSNLGALPLGEMHLERIANLLDRVYDQTYSYVQGDFDLDYLEQIHGQIEYVNQELKELLIHKEREFPWVSWHEYLSTKVAVPNFMQTLALINDELEEFKAPLRHGEIMGESISKEEALEAARVFSGREDLSFQVTNEAKGNLPSYTVEAKDGDARFIIEVSQRGGIVLWMSVAQEVRESNFTIEDMVERGVEFLRERGFPLLHVTDVQVLQNKATITFVPARDGVLRYTEPLKVQVSAGDGSIIGFWGILYHMAQSRQSSLSEVLQDVAWNIEDKVVQGIEILDQKLALILNEQQEETLVKRLGVQYQEEYYLIYLNAETGEEEQIVQVGSAQFF